MANWQLFKYHLTCTQNYKGLYGVLQLLQRSHLDNFPPKTLKLGWVAFYSLAFQLKETRSSALTFLQVAHKCFVELNCSNHSKLSGYVP